VDGGFDLSLRDGRNIIGKVRGGTVTWPALGRDIGCGVLVARVSLDLTYETGVAAAGAGDTGAGSFRGCLHDLPAGTVIPPRIWGTLQ
jgi:hypothetical protein